MQVTNITVSYPKEKIKPIIYINAPSLLGRCDSLTIDVSSSLGNCGRPWTSAFVRIDGNANFDAMKYLNDFVNSVNFTASLLTSVTTIPNLYLEPDTSYFLTIKLCNFFGNCGQSIHSFAVLDALLPTVTILGPSYMTIRRQAPPLLTASASFFDCNIVQNYGLSYSWQVTDAQGGVLLQPSDQITMSSDPSQFRLSPSSLQVSSTYTIVVTVSSVVVPATSSASVTILVTMSDLVARIKGGNIQRMNPQSYFVLDGTGSQDPDAILTSSSSFSSNSMGLTFEWTCVTIAPTYSSSCALTLLNDTSNALLTTFALSRKAAGKTCFFTLLVSDSSTNRVATANVTVVINSEPLPLTRILTTSSFPYKVNPNTKFSLIGSVITTVLPTTASWSLNDVGIKLEAISRTPVSLPITSPSLISIPINTILTIPANVLPPGMVLTFTLTASFNLHGQTSSSTSIQIIVNDPPKPGSHLVSPSSGTELLTQFVITAVNWVDEDLPISYAFLLLSPTPVDANRFLLLQSRSQMPFVTTTFPHGTVKDMMTQEKTTTCVMQVYDALDANTSSTRFVAVAPMNFSSISNDWPVSSSPTGFVAEMLKSSLISNAASPNGVIRAISIYGGFLNSVDCSFSPNCTLLNRKPCMTTSHTCGACIDSFVGAGGIQGDGNTMCLNVSAVQQAVSLISSPTSSLGRYRERHLLSTERYFLCPAMSCSGHGTCVFEDLRSGNVLNSSSLTSSTAFSLQVRSVCICNQNYFGDDCSLRADEFLMRRTMREQMMQALVQVVGDTSYIYDDISIACSCLGTISLIVQVNTEVSPLTLELAISTILNIVETAAKSQSQGLPSEATTGPMFQIIDSVARANSNVSASAIRTGTMPDMFPIGKLFDIASVLIFSSDTGYALVKTNQFDTFKFISQTFDNLFGINDYISSLQSHISLMLPFSDLESANLYLNAAPVSSVVIDRFSTSHLSIASILQLETLSVTFSSITSRSRLVPYSIQANDVSFDVGFISASHRLRIFGGGIVCSQGQSNNSVNSEHWSQIRALFKLSHDKEEVFGTIKTPNSTFQTYCKKNKVSSTTYTCPRLNSKSDIANTMSNSNVNSNGNSSLDNLNVTVTCDGKKEYIGTTHCPTLVRVPSCQVLVDEAGLISLDAQTCQLSSYTSTFTVCSCDFCSERALATSTPDFNVSDIFSTTYNGVIEVVSVAVLNVTSLYSTITLAPGDDQPMNVHVGSELFASLCFISLWAISSLAFFFGMRKDNQESNKKTWKFGSISLFRKRQKLSNKPTKKKLGHSKLDMMDSSDGEILNSVESQEYHKRQFTLQLENLKAYIGSLFPQIYTDESPPFVRLCTEVSKTHKYLRIICSTPSTVPSHLRNKDGFRWQRFVYFFEVVSNSSFSIFTLGILYANLFPYDDGTCSSFTTEMDCNSRSRQVISMHFTANIFSSVNRRNMCTWTTHSNEGPWMQTSICTFASTNMGGDSLVLIYVAMFVIVISTIYSYVISAISCNILLAPPSGHLLPCQFHFEDSLVQETANQEGYDNYDTTDDTGKHTSISWPLVHSVSSKLSHLRSLLISSSILDNVPLHAKNGIDYNSENIDKSLLSSEHLIDMISAHRDSLVAATKQSLDRKELLIFDRSWQITKASKNNSQWRSNMNGTPTGQHSSIVPWLPLPGLSEGQSIATHTNNAEISGNFEDCFINPGFLQNLVVELDDVEDQASSYLYSLSTMFPNRFPNEEEVIGTKLMHILIKDLIGRDSLGAALFDSKAHEILSSQLPYSTFIKGFFVVSILVIDFTYFLVCLTSLRGMSLAMVSSWFLCSMLIILFDAVWLETSTCLILQYWIPATAHAKIIEVRNSIISALISFLSVGDHASALKDETSRFSSFDFFFISSRIARAYDNIIESPFILSIRSPLLPIITSKNIITRGIIFKVTYLARIFLKLHASIQSLIFKLFYMACFFGLITLLFMLFPSSSNPWLPLVITSAIFAFIVYAPLTTCAIKHSYVHNSHARVSTKNSASIQSLDIESDMSSESSRDTDDDSNHSNHSNHSNFNGHTTTKELEIHSDISSDSSDDSDSEVSNGTKSENRALDKDEDQMRDKDEGQDQNSNKETLIPPLSEASTIDASSHIQEEFGRHEAEDGDFDIKLASHLFSMHEEIQETENQHFLNFEISSSDESDDELDDANVKESNSRIDQEPPTSLTRNTLLQRRKSHTTSGKTLRGTSILQKGLVDNTDFSISSDDSSSLDSSSGMSSIILSSSFDSNSSDNSDDDHSEPQIEENKNFVSQETDDKWIYRQSEQDPESTSSAMSPPLNHVNDMNDNDIIIEDVYT